MRRAVLALMLTCCADAPATPPFAGRRALLGAEVPVDAPVYGAPANDQDQPAAGTTATSYVFAWNDTRFSTVGTSEIVAARVAFDGGALDPYGVYFGIGVSPEVACRSDQCLVAWANYADIHAKRIAADGTLLDATRLTISTGNQVKDDATVGCDGTNYLVAWRDDRAAMSQIWARRVGSDGVFAGAEFQVSPAAVAQSQPDVTCATGGPCIVSWRTAAGVLAARVDTAGMVLDPSGFQVSVTAGGNPAAATGPQTLILWDDGTGILGRRFDNVSGAPLEAPFTVPGTSNRNRAAAAWDGTSFQLAWQSSNPTAYTATLEADGGLQGVVSSLGNGSSPALATEGPGRAFAAFTVFSHVRGALVGSGSPVSLPNVVAAANSQFYPELAANDAGILVTWTDTRTDNYVVMGRAFDLQGAPRAPARALGDGGFDQISSQVAAGPGQFLTVWQQGGTERVTGVIVANDGQPISPRFGVAGASPQLTPAAALGPGNVYLVVFTEQAATNDVVGFTVDTAGVAGGRFPISAAAGVGEFNPVVAGTSTQWLAVWTEGQRIRATRIGAPLVPLDIPPLSLGSMHSSQYDPVVTTDGSSFLVAWFDSYELSVVRISAAGAIVDATPLTFDNSLPSDAQPGVAFDGRRFLVTWNRNDGSGVMRGIGASGPALGPANVVLPNTPRRAWVRAAWFAEQGLVVSSGYERAAPFMSVRLSSRALTLGAPGSVCTIPLECRSALCGGGVCTELDGGTAGGSGAAGGAGAAGGSGNAGGSPGGGPAGGAGGGGPGGGSGASGGSGGGAGSGGGGGNGGDSGGAGGARGPGDYQVGCSAAGAELCVLAALLLIQRRRRRS